MNQEYESIFEDILKRGSYSITKPRKIVFSCLMNQEPISMHELLAKVNNDIDRASLYRTIRIFEKLGIVQRVYIGWKYKIELTDIFSHHHHHISCVKCHKLIVIKEDAEIEELIQAIAKRYEVKATNHQLEVQGYCNSCQSNNVEAT